MEVVPLAEGTADLPVHEPLARCPFVDSGTPPDGNAVQAESIVDERSRVQGCFWCTSNTEMEEGRSQLFQIVRGGKKWKNRSNWTRDPLGAAEPPVVTDTIDGRWR